VIVAHTQGLDFVTARFYLFMMRSISVEPSLTRADGRLQAAARQSKEKLPDGL
jgi:hypothetical protein